MKWFWKTFKGYKIIWVCPDYEVTFIHRPFREPGIIRNRPEQGKLRGKQFSAVLFDEAVETLPNGDGLGGQKGTLS